MAALCGKRHLGLHDFCYHGRLSIGEIECIYGCVPRICDPCLSSDRDTRKHSDAVTSIVRYDSLCLRVMTRRNIGII